MNGVGNPPNVATRILYASHPVNMMIELPIRSRAYWIQLSSYLLSLITHASNEAEKSIKRSASTIVKLGVIY
ncbi:hypothetical protein DS909_00065 [Phaeobacter gallaeciensis]|uniref:Uncharacterized protein n=1 Tax=Phaeobacter gallaeciensis TaxID=60890 RepID=A0A366XEC0_9RHOB|nr:hypothetical protein DS909_00065 [Phaeobacter gallaeciensis]